MSEEGNLKDVLGPVLRVLKGLGGKFVFTDSDGDTFVLMSKAELTRVRQKQEQLPLPPARAVEAAVRQHAPDIAEDVIEAINRDIALSQNQPDVAGDDFSLPLAPPAPKLRFEPLKGDISPDLQE